MRRLPLAEHGDPVEVLAVTRDVRAAGGVILLPTETFYGLAADPASEAGVARVYALKDRPAGLPLPVLCADWEQVTDLVEVPENYRVRLSRAWPGPLTVVLRARRRLPAAAGVDTLAVRVPGHPLLRAVLYVVGPLTGTSANRHGRAPATMAEVALAALVGEPDLLLDGGTTPGGTPSSLVDLSSGDPRILRPGPVSWA